MPPQREYNKYLKRLWKSHILTNHGELVQELEKKLQKYWKVKNVVCVANGTSAIQIALRALNIKEIYTSPFSFVATVAAPIWLGVKVKFFDFNESAPKNKPLLATHVYGIPNPQVGKPTIYDASHAFTTKLNGKSILTCGDVSIISFNAVKIFQTGEGGALVTNNDEIADKAKWMRNYGYKTRYSFNQPAMNAKMSELHAAMGLAVLPYVERVRKRFNQIVARYNRNLGKFLYPDYLTYYPVQFPSEKNVFSAIKEFEKNGVFPRRYFYPPLNKVFGGKKCPKAEDYMSKTLTLPLHYYLENSEVDMISKIAKKYL